MKLNKMWLLDEADDFAGGDFSGSGSSGGAAVVNEPNEQPPPTAPPAAAPIALAPEQFSALLARVTTPQAPQAPTQISDEDWAKATKRPVVTEDAVKAIFSADASPAQQAQALQQMLIAASEHAYTLARMEMGLLKQDYDTRLAPVLTAHQERSAESFADKVTKAYPALGTMKPLIRQVMDQFRASGGSQRPEAQDEQQLIRLIAGLSESYAKTVNPNFSLQSQTSSGGRSGMPSMAGGDGGSAGGGGGARKSATAEALDDMFGKP